MSELTKNDIIEEYKNRKKQEEKIDTLNESIKNLNETLGKFMALVTGKKEGEEGKKESKTTVPTGIEGKKEKKEEKKEEESIFSKFLGL